MTPHLTLLKYKKKYKLYIELYSKWVLLYIQWDYAENMQCRKLYQGFIPYKIQR